MIPNIVNSVYWFLLVVIVIQPMNGILVTQNVFIGIISLFFQTVYLVHIGLKFFEDKDK